jgi:hypothetical protein
MNKRAEKSGGRSAWVLAVGLVLAVFPRLVLGVPAAPSCEQQFVRGDVDADSRLLITDAVLLLNFLFASTGALPCADAADVNDNGRIDVSDAIFYLNFRFRTGGVLPPPSPGCGVDPTPDSLGCEAFSVCPERGTPEVCDVADNDCDGEVDEGFDLRNDVANCGFCGTACADKNWENVVAYACVGGGCAIARCEEGFFDADGVPENGCESVVPRNGSPCNDGNPCTDGDIWIGGLCGGTPRICAELDGECVYGICDARTGDCVTVPRTLNLPCDDGDPNTVNDHCNPSGECIGLNPR